MPYATHDGVRLFYETCGSGDPVLLVAGLGRDMDLWDAQRNLLSERFQVLLLDNRGAGRSDAPQGPYTAAQMAADACAVLDHAGVRQAHVVGASLGGFLAQELALRWPDRVRRLALLGTSFGSDRSLRMSETVWRTLADRGPDEEGYLWRVVPLAFSEGWVEAHHDLVAGSIRRRVERPMSHLAWLSQAHAGATFSSYDRLPELPHETLVMAGTADLVVPSPNAWMLSRRIPRARLVLYPGAGHCFFVERPEEVNRDLVAFLEGRP